MWLSGPYTLTLTDWSGVPPRVTGESRRARALALAAPDGNDREGEGCGENGCEDGTRAAYKITSSEIPLIHGRHRSL